MSSLKKDITQILANLYSQAYADGAVGHSRNDDILTAHKEIINLIKSVADKIIGEDEYDNFASESKRVRATHRDVLRAEQRNIKSKLIGEE
jgi:hypothetical protein